MLLALYVLGLSLAMIIAGAWITLGADMTFTGKAALLAIFAASIVALRLLPVNKEARFGTAARQVIPLSALVLTLLVGLTLVQNESDARGSLFLILPLFAIFPRFVCPNRR